MDEIALIKNTMYLARKASKLLSKIAVETAVEIQILFEKWQLLLVGLILQNHFRHPLLKRYLALGGEKVVHIAAGAEHSALVTGLKPSGLSKFFGSV